MNAKQLLDMDISDHFTPKKREPLKVPHSISFDLVKKMDDKLKVQKTSLGIRVTAYKKDFLDGSSFLNFLRLSNSDVDIDLIPNMEVLNYKPNQSLVKKSKLPLWVLSVFGPGQFLIKRISL